MKAVWGAAFLWATTSFYPAQTRAAGDPAEMQAAALVAKMTASEKVGQMINTAPAIPRLGIPAYQWWTEALHGALAEHPTTDFPEPIGLAATFDDQLVHDVATAISGEVRANHDLARSEGRNGSISLGEGLDVWAPNINIFRDPRWGRGQETYGEDPFLTARMGVAYILGMQGPNPDRPRVIATPKHFAVHSGPESTRHAADVKVSPHDLEDTYLPAFRAAIVEAHAGSIMCAYNRVNGQPACANDFLIKTKLRQQWGFRGYVVSDCGAIDDISGGHRFAPDAATAGAVALHAGMDNECAFGSSRYGAALEKGLISDADVDQALVRLFAARIRVGDLAPDGRAQAAAKPAGVVTPAHRALALKVAEESIVLLKNSGVLPLAARARTIVVTGPLADSTRVLRGNYSSEKAPDPVSLLAGLRAQFPNALIRYVPAGASRTDGEPMPRSVLYTPDGHPGVSVALFASEPGAPGGFETKPYRTQTVDGVGRDLDGAREHYKAVFTGVIAPKVSGLYRLGVRGGEVQLSFGPKVLAQVGANAGALGDLNAVRLEAGRRYPFRIEVQKNGWFNAHLVWARVSEDPAAALRKAAKGADLIIAAVGLTSDLEGEESNIEIPGFSGGDRTSLELPADQLQLLATAKETGKPLVVVSMSGSAVNLSWAKTNADAILQAWYPGEEGGAAIARILAGRVAPSGRLPVTFYRSVDDLPPFADYSMANRTYRYFTGSAVYPFGYGLSYTSFRYAPLHVTHGADGVKVQTRLTNTGRTAGDEVAELYLQVPDQPGAPRLALRGFQRVRLAPGETRELAFRLGPRDLSSVEADGVRKAFAGEYRVSVGGGQPGSGAPAESATFRLDRTVDVAD